VSDGEPADRPSAERAAALQEDRRVRARALRNWLLPFVVLGFGVYLLIVVGHLKDGGASLFLALNGSHPAGGHHEAESEVLGNVAQLVGQVLGVAISVVAIIVELAANRYTHRITELFFRARTNVIVMGLYVVSAVQPMWASFASAGGHVPRATAIVSMGLMTFSVLSLLPYFSYVAAFVSPIQIIGRLRRESLRLVAEAPRTDSTAAIEAAQRAAEESSEQLTDIALNAMVHHDKAISMAAINAIGDLLKDFLAVKPKLPASWFKMSPSLRTDPDFVSLAPVALEHIEESRTWFEFMLLRQYEMLYRQALNSHRELNYLIASNLRELAVRAMDRGDTAVLELSVKFFNTLLRATINARDVRTGYNLLNQYRQVAEVALRRAIPRLPVTIARHFKYYGQLAFNMDLGFLLETVAYDLCTINELAFDLGARERPELLKVFLQVDKEGEGAKKEIALRGVRKAQVKLATYYLLNEDEAAARQVHRDMANENVLRLASIRDELLSVDSPHYWEVTDRGMNFDWLPPERRRQLFEFFDWFGDALPQPRASIVLPVNATALLESALATRSSAVVSSVVEAVTSAANAASADAIPSALDMEEERKMLLRDPGAATEDQRGARPTHNDASDAAPRSSRAGE
jgi:hypothetical protein